MHGFKKSIFLREKNFGGPQNASFRPGKELLAVQKARSGGPKSVFRGYLSAAEKNFRKAHLAARKETFKPFFPPRKGTSGGRKSQNFGGQKAHLFSAERNFRRSKNSILPRGKELLSPSFRRGKELPAVKKNHFLTHLSAAERNF
jgi:hypothetical protein